MTPVLESAVEQHLLTRCRGNGYLCLKFVSPGRAGVPDRIIVAPGGTVFVEVKRPGGRLRRLQQVTIARLKSAGGEVFVVDGRSAVDALVDELAARVTVAA